MAHCAVLRSTRLSTLRRTSHCCLRPHVSVKNAKNNEASGELIERYTYNSEDGVIQKATIEHVFSGLQQQDDDTAGAVSLSSTPWGVGWQMSERNILWNDDLKLRLIKRIASQELGISDEELDWRLEQVALLLPDLHSRLIAAPPRLVARLAARTPEIGVRLLRLKIIFPKANLPAMVNQRLSLILDDNLDEIEAARAHLEHMLPDFNIDKFVEAFPAVLDVDCFKMAVEDAERIMPGTNVPEMLRANPDIILSLMKGKNLIPYDEFDNPWS